MEQQKRFAVIKKVALFIFIICVFFITTSEFVNAQFANCPGDTVNGWWDINNTQTVNTTTIICEYINISNGGRLYVNSSIDNATVNITVGNLTIQNGGEINGTGTGFLNSSSQKTSVGRSGGSHGGRGGTTVGAGSSGSQYGNALEPRTLGSSGGAGDIAGDAGGGSVLINVSNITWVNGTIAINGEPRKTGFDNGGGGGAGGSLYLDTDQLYGNGTLQAMGGQGRDTSSDGSSGGGGRIAVYYKTIGFGFNFNSTLVTSLAPPGTGAIGDPGTAVFIDKDDKNLNIVQGFDFTLATYNYSNVTIEHALLRVNRSFELNASGFVNTGNRITNMSCYNTSHDFTFRILKDVSLSNFNLSDRGVIYNDCGNITILRTETRTNMTINRLTLFSNKTMIFNITNDDLVLNASLFYGNVNFTGFANLSIFSTSILNASERGNKNGTFEGKGNNNANGGGGGGYGGIGATGEAGGKGGNGFGDVFSPNALGAPGGAGNNGAAIGSAGGGLIYINLTGTLWNNGTIAVDGETAILGASGIDGGSGSGGSIWIDVVNFYGVGFLSARGGSSGIASNAGGTGSGGRIAVYYNTTNSEIGFNRTNVEGKKSADGNVLTGDSGTAVFIDKDDKNLNIVQGFDFTLATYNYSNVTIEHAFLRVNRSFEFNATSFVNTGGRFSNMTCNNLSHNINFSILRDLGLENFNLSDKGANFHECGNITMHRIETRTNYSVSYLTIQSNGTLNFNVTNDDLIFSNVLLFGNMNFTVANMSINGTSFLIANFRGAGNGTGLGTGGANTSGGGAGYGGRGGNGQTAGGVGGATYGSNLTPIETGSGGGGTKDGSKGGVGGGQIFINATNRLEFNGTINASGGVGASVGGNGVGGGSGGSIWIWTLTLNGTGKLSVHGGNGIDLTTDGGGGGGGRIAVYFKTDQTNGYTRDANGGEGFGAVDGAVGTIEFLQTNASIGNVTPTLEQVVFNVSSATKTSGLAANTTYSDPTGDLGNIFFRWFRNNTEISSQNFTGITNKTVVNSTLSVNSYNRGDTINISVYANDGNTNTSAYNNSLVIQNTAPIQGTPILNSTFKANNTDENLTVFNISVIDPDNDVITTYYEWFRNDVSYFNSTTNILSTGNLSGGLKWNVSVIVSDISSNSSISFSNTLMNNYLNVSLIAPPNGSRESATNLQFNFNVTAGNTVICSLFNNDTGIYRNVSSLSTITQNGNNSITHNNILENNSIAWNAECISPAGTRFFALSNFTVAVDRINPLLAFNNPIRANTTTSLNQIVQPNITCTDVGGLFEFLVNITNSTNQSIYSNLTTNLTGTQYNFTPLINFSNNATGIYQARVECSDDHTDKEIPDYDVVIDEEEGEIKVDTDSDTSISIDLISSSVDLADIDTYKDSDRYSYIYDYGDVGDEDKESDEETFVYHITSDHEIFYRDASSYTAHFVTGKNWIDFEGVEGKFTVFENETGWYVEITTSELYQNFSSIGGLNIVSENVTFSHGFVNGTYVHPQTPTNTSFISGVQTINVTADHVAKNITLITIFRDGINVTTCTNQNWCNFTENVSALSVGIHSFNASIVAGVNERNITEIRNYSNSLNYTINQAVMGIIFATEGNYNSGGVVTENQFESRYSYTTEITVNSNATQNLSSLIYSIPRSRLNDFTTTSRDFDIATVNGLKENVTLQVNATDVIVNIGQKLSQGNYSFRFNYSSSTFVSSQGSSSTGTPSTTTTEEEIEANYLINGENYSEDNISMFFDVTSTSEYLMAVEGIKGKYSKGSELNVSIFTFKGTVPYSVNAIYLELWNVKNNSAQIFNVNNWSGNYYSVITGGIYNVEEKFRKDLEGNFTINVGVQFDNTTFKIYSEKTEIVDTLSLKEKIINFFLNIDKRIYVLIAFIVGIIILFIILKKSMEKNDKV